MFLADLAVKVAGLDPVLFWIFCAGLSLGSVACFFGLWRLFGRYRIIHDTPTSRIRSASQGYVELDGRARMLGGEPIIAPHMLIPCVWWRYTIKKRSESSKGGSNWRLVESGSSDGLFMLEDATGRCVIDPEGAIATPLHKKSWRGGEPYSGSAGAYNIGRMGGNYRYQVEWIADGDPIFALGWFKSIRGVDEFNRRNAVRDKLSQWKKQPQYLQQYDANRDGEIDVDEWQAVRAAAKAEVDREYAELAVSEHHNLLQKSADSRPYLLTAKPLDDLAKKYLWQAMLSAVAFLVAGAAAVWMLNIRF